MLRRNDQGAMARLFSNLLTHCVGSALLLASVSCSFGVLDDLSGGESAPDGGDVLPGDGDGDGDRDGGAEAPHCNNGKQDEGESALDCGGSTTCDRCDTGKSCMLSSDCASLNCSSDKVCVEATCSDHVKNQDEEYIDCGGSCDPCEPCANGKQDADEIGIDCGGSCDVACITGSTCKSADDCASATCGSDSVCHPGRRGAYWSAADWLGAPSQMPEQVPWPSLNYVYVANVGITPTYECAFWTDAGKADKADAAALQSAKALVEYRNSMAKGVRVLLSIGGPLLSYRFSAAANAENREKFAASCVKLMADVGADGIDLDWRFPTAFAGPASGTGSCRDDSGCASDTDAANFTALLEEFRRQFQVAGARGSLLTAVLRANSTTDGANVPYNYKALFGGKTRLLDWATVATYDFHRSAEATVNFGAPFPDTVNAMAFASTRVGKSAMSSLLVGLSLSGPQWSDVTKPGDSGVGNPGTGAGSVTFATLDDYVANRPAQCAAYTPATGNTRNRYVWCSGVVEGLSNRWMSFDDPSVLTNKAKTSLISGYAGASVWLLGQDTTSNKAMTAIVQGMDAQNPLGDAALALPGTIEVENYDAGGEGLAYHDITPGNSDGAYRFDDVDVEMCSDRGGGFDVEDFLGGEWLEYTVTPQQAGNYNVEFRVASTRNNSALHLEESGNRVTENSNVPSTGGAQSWTTVELNGVALQARPQQLRLISDSGAFAVNWMRFSRGQVPYLGVPFAVPGTIETEFFDVGGPEVGYHDTSRDTHVIERTGPVFVDANFDSNGGLHVRDIQAGEWLAYTVRVAKAGEHNVEVRVASSAVHSLHLANGSNTNLSGPIAIPSIGESDEFLTVEARTPTNLPAGEQVLKLAFDTVGDGTLNINWLRLTQGQVPYSGTPWRIPGTIEAEAFDLGGADEAYHDATPGNAFTEYRYTDVDIEPTTDESGGFDVTSVAENDWLEYTVDVQDAAKYDFEVRAASFQGGASLHFEVDGTNVGTVNIDSTGGPQNWTTFKLENVELTAGTHVLRAAFDSAKASYNWFRFTPSP
jgi:hypothetical protein